jgi:hypothetical protein
MVTVLTKISIATDQHDKMGVQEPKTISNKIRTVLLTNIYSRFLSFAIYIRYFLHVKRVTCGQVCTIHYLRNSMTNIRLLLVYIHVPIYGIW